jgi:hypothetical protein
VYHNPEDHGMNNYVVIFEEGILVVPMFECFFACVIWDNKYFLKRKAPEKLKAQDKFKQVCQTNES